MEPILTVAFVIAVTAFLKEQFGLNGKAALVGAFVVALLAGFAPNIAAMFPTAQPWIESLFNVITLFLSAAGSYDFVMEIKAKYSK